MDGEYSKWGPNMDHYVPNFQKRLETAFDNYTSAREITTPAHGGLIPLALLETMLAVGENMHKVGFQHGRESLTILMETIRRYSKLQKGGIFSHYYGFLCIRHVIRMTCIGTLLHSDALGDFLLSVRPNMSCQDVSNALGREALQQLEDALRDGSLMGVYEKLGCEPPYSEAFPLAGGLFYDDVDLLLRMIWRDRRAMMALRGHGLLPGLAVLLFTLSEMTIYSDAPIEKKPWIWVLDILLRCYVVADTERATLRQLCIFARGEIARRGLVRERRVDPEDARDMIKAYAEMMSLDNPPDLDVVKLDISHILYQHVESLLSKDLEDCVPVVVKAGLDRLWMAFDRERHIETPAHHREILRQYATDIFYACKVMKASITTKFGQFNFVQMLLQSDILGLAGRVLMLVTREDDEPNSWSPFIESLSNILESLTTSVPVTAEQVDVSAVNWQKVSDYLWLLCQALLPFNVHGQYIIEAFNAWRELRPVDVGDMPGLTTCANPRCAVVTTRMKPKDAYTVCGRCYSATYCSPRCQTIHWNLRIGSHAYSCHSSERKFT